MKAKIFTVMALGLLILNANAQKNIDAVIKKCETHSYPSVDMEVIKRNNKDGKREDSKMVNIRINGDKKLVTEFLEAFKKDEADAEDVDIRKIKGKEVSIRLKFPQMYFSIHRYDENKARISANYNTENRFDIASNLQFNLNNMNFNMDSVRFRLDSMKFNLEKQQEEWLPYVKKHQEKIDSLVRISSKRIKSINWDSIASEFAKDVDSALKEIKKE
jgi:hypothetical protein